ncbi:MAG: hypothetical protein ACI80N_003610 [Gammaproteobacteria bacterium]|jgi:hypothetical protein
MSVGEVAVGLRATTVCRSDGRGAHGIAARVTQALVTSTRRQKSRMSPSVAAT